jgi:hypothetical protein
MRECGLTRSCDGTRTRLCGAKEFGNGACVLRETGLHGSEGAAIGLASVIDAIRKNPGECLTEACVLAFGAFLFGYRMANGN